MRDPSSTPKPSAEPEVPSSAGDLAALYGDMSIAIEYVPIEGVKPYTRALKKHSRRQIEKLADSIRAFGFVQPLVIDEAGEIIAGHGLVEAARQAGYREAQKRALRIGLNRLAELSNWDGELLAIEFEEIVALDLALDLSFDIAITGFDAPEIDQLIETSHEGAAPDADDVVPPPGPGAPVSRLGDLWHLGPHRILCGDAMTSATSIAAGPERCCTATTSLSSFSSRSAARRAP